MYNIKKTNKIIKPFNLNDLIIICNNITNKNKDIIIMLIICCCKIIILSRHTKKLNSMCQFK